jgi:hypothetical protein
VCGEWGQDAVLGLGGVQVCVSVWVCECVSFIGCTVRDRVCVSSSLDASRMCHPCRELRTAVQEINPHSVVHVPATGSVVVSMPGYSTLYVCRSLMQSILCTCRWLCEEQPH